MYYSQKVLRIYNAREGNIRLGRLYSRESYQEKQWGFLFFIFMLWREEEKHENFGNISWIEENLLRLFMEPLFKQKKNTK